MNRGIAGGERFKFIRCGNERRTGDDPQFIRNPAGVFGMSVQSGTYRGSPNASSATCGKLFSMCLRLCSSIATQPEISAKRKWSCILQMCTTNFNDIGESVGLITERFGQHI